MDIPAELIREQVGIEAQLEDSLRVFDPLVGGLVASFHVSDGSKRPWSFIAFPMGESGCDLSEGISHSARRRANVISDFSSIDFSAEGNIITEPSHYPVKTFETPICQIVSSPVSSDLSKGTFSYFLAEKAGHAEQRPWWESGHSHRHRYHLYPCQHPRRERRQLS